MKRIVILGSKPNAIVPRGEKIYCANAAIISNEDPVSRFVDRVAVASSAVLGAGLNPGSDRGDVYKQKLDAVRDGGMSRIILLESPFSPDTATQVKSYLQTEGRNPDVSEIGVRQRIKMVKSIAQTPYPLVGASFSAQPFSVRLRDRMDIGHWYWQWHFGEGRRDVSPKYRPSTGILALLLAIAENGKKVDYVLAGIGVKDRNIAKVKTFTATIPDTPVGELPQHVHADLMILENLLCDYSLSSTEAELTEAIPGLRLHR